MQIVRTVSEWQRLAVALKTKTIGFIPTMGCLHAGHLSLVQHSLSDNDVTVLSCFVNPTQFNDSLDFKKYPRPIQNDIAWSEQAGVDYFFSPVESALYPHGYRYCVMEKESHQLMEGLHRPGYFSGVLTIVLKLLLLIEPDRAYFGEKDFQQLQLIQGMVEDFFMKVQIVSCPTIRDSFGVPFSSRHAHFTEAQMIRVRYFSYYLSSKLSDQNVIACLKHRGFEVDYVETHEGRRYGAVRLDGVRLIDNVECASC